MYNPKESCGGLTWAKRWEFALPGTSLPHSWCPDLIHQLPAIIIFHENLGRDYQWFIIIYWTILLSILNMLFHVFGQVVGLWGCKVTLIAFVWFFSTVYFQMSFQTFLTFLHCVFSNVPSNCSPKMMYSHTDNTCMFDFTLLCLFICVLKLLASEDA